MVDPRMDHMNLGSTMPTVAGSSPFRLSSARLGMRLHVYGSQSCLLVPFVALSWFVFVIPTIAMNLVMSLHHWYLTFFTHPPQALKYCETLYSYYVPYPFFTRR
jgi:hypothetical protein